MNKKKISLIIAGLMLLVSILACGVSTSTASLDDVRLTRDSNGNDPTNVFGPEETFYCIANLVNAPNGTVVRAEWYAVNVEGEEPNTFIDSAEVTSGDGTLTFDLSNEGPWPLGTYKVELYMNDELKQTLEFTVQ